MKKLKKAWANNRVIIVLGIIVIVCIIIILGVMISYFVGTGKSSYGDRLVEIEKMAVKNEDKNRYLEKIEENELVDTVNFSVSGGIIYIKITVVEKASLVEAQSIATASLDQLDEEYLKIYDINFTIEQAKTETVDGFLVMGAKNVNGTGLYWSNMTVSD